MRHLNSYLVLATLFFSCFVCYIVALIKDFSSNGPWNLVDSTTDTYTDLTAYSAGTIIK